MPCVTGIKGIDYTYEDYVNLEKQDFKFKYKSAQEKIKIFKTTIKHSKIECGFLNTKDGQLVDKTFDFIKTKRGKVVRKSDRYNTVSTYIFMLDCYKRSERKYGEEDRDSLWKQIAQKS